MRYSLHHFENNPFFRESIQVPDFMSSLMQVIFLEKMAIRKIRVSVVKEDNFLQQVFFAGKEVDEVSQKIKKTRLPSRKKPTWTKLNKV